MNKLLRYCLLLALSCTAPFANAQIGKRFPSEKRVVPDPVTGVPLTFLTNEGPGDSKIYPTHPQWTADGKWLIFRSARAAHQAFAVNEENGAIIQVTQTGYEGSLCIAQKTMRLFFLRYADHATRSVTKAGEKPAPGPTTGVDLELVATDLAALFADSEKATVKDQGAYEKILAKIPHDFAIASELALDADETAAYVRLTKEAAGKLLPSGTKIEEKFGPRNMGAGPSGIGRIDLQDGTHAPVVAVPFQVGHVQSNPWKTGEIIFCWETGGKSPQRMWSVMADGSNLRKLYPESEYDWVTHEAVITPDEVAFALMGHRDAGVSDGWGPSGSRVHPTGLGILNLRTNEVYIAGQTKSGSGLWHVHGSPDGRWAVGDDFSRSLYLIDRKTNEMMLISTGHKESAADHTHPTFHPDGTRFQIQSAMLAKDGRAMGICIVPVPEAWLKRTYDDKTGWVKR